MSDEWLMLVQWVPTCTTKPLLPREAYDYNKDSHLSTIITNENAGTEGTKR
jgi:hypothetical protein